VQILYLISSLFFILGFDYLGKKISSFFKIKKIIKNISNPYYQNSLIGISFFIFIIYPIFFLGLFNFFLFLFFSCTILIFGILNLLVYYKSFLNFFKINFLILIKRNKFIEKFYFILLILYFLLAILPISSADSVAYHLSVAKYLLLHSKFPSTFYDSGNVLAGAGELLDAFALVIGAYQFTSLVNFIGIISVLAILNKFADNLGTLNSNKHFLFLSILSCPILIFLVATSKTQLFSISLIFFSYALLLNCLNENQDRNYIIKSIFICTSLCIVAIQTKISFSLSFFLILINFLFFFRKLLTLKIFFLLILLICYSLLPPSIWKQQVYNYNFYNFLWNPFPLNIPGYLDVYLGTKEYLSNKFPLILFAPLSLGDLTQFIGVGLFSTFFLVKNKFQNKNFYFLIIIIFILVMSLLGQKTARFFLEIYFFIILLMVSVLNKIYKTTAFKLLKFGILLQSFLVFVIILFSVFVMIPGLFSKNLNHIVLSKYANGYNLYNWVNKVLPEKSTFITFHRSTYFSDGDAIFFDMAGHLNYLDLNTKNFFLEKIKQRKPKYILFYGYEMNFSYNKMNFYKCTNGLYAKKIGVGFEETRNPFNSKMNRYDAYIYNFDYTKLPYCVYLNY
jgi:hypothetical protein